MGLGELTQALRRLDRIAGDEREGGRTGEQRLEAGDAGIGRGPLRERVLGHRVGRVPTQRAPQVGDLRHGQATVRGQQGRRRAAEPLGQLGDGGRLVESDLVRHVPPLGARAGGSRARQREMPRRGAHGAWQSHSIQPPCAGRPLAGGAFDQGEPW